MDLQAPYLGNQTQETLSFVFPAELCQKIAVAYLKGRQPITAYTYPRVHAELFLNVPVGVFKLPFRLEGQTWQQFIATQEQSGTYMQGPYEVGNRKISWQFSEDLIDQVWGQVTAVVNGRSPADIPGEVLVLYESSTDYRGNGYDLGSPSKDW